MSNQNQFPSYPQITEDVQFAELSEDERARIKQIADKLKSRLDANEQPRRQKYFFAIFLLILLVFSASAFAGNIPCSSPAECQIREWKERRDLRRIEDAQRQHNYDMRRQIRQQNEMLEQIYWQQRLEALRRRLREE